MNTNFDKLNYLNLINPRLGKLYDLGAFNPLSNDFKLTKELIEERLRLSEMAQNVVYPEFIHGDKDDVKSAFKTSLKNLKKLSKCRFDCSEDFARKLDLYIFARIEVTKGLLKEFKSYRFDECTAFEEIYSIDPIFCELLNLFDKDFDVDMDFGKLEESYNLSYAELLKLQNARRKKGEKSAQKLAELNAKKLAENSKIASPNAKNEKSTKNKSEKLTKKVSENSKGNLQKKSNFSASNGTKIHAIKNEKN